MTLQDTVRVRPAQTPDAYDLAQLIDIAGEGIPHWIWSRSCDAKQAPIDIGADRARRDTGGFSYTNATVAQIGPNIVGMVLSYPIDQAPEDDPDSLPAPIAPFVELEARSVGTWYINALAVRPGQRGHGIGAQLMSVTERAGRDRGYAKATIQVFEQNTGACRLYHRLGYREIARRPVRHHPCQPYYSGDVVLLERPIDQASLE